jgi:hypothetical protein
MYGPSMFDGNLLRGSNTTTMTNAPQSPKLSMKGRKDGRFDFLGYLFTKAELEPHVGNVGERQIELAGRRLAKLRAATFNAEFSKAAGAFIERVVVDWGKGNRNWHRVGTKESQDKLARKIHEILPQLKKRSPSQLVAELDGCVKGLRVSYASKLLRMLCPERFPVLDAMLEEALGIARNPTGYELFCKELARFIERHQPRSDGELLLVADLELAIYRLNQERRKGKHRPKKVAKKAFTVQVA